MDFNLIRLDIEQLLNDHAEKIVVVLNYKIPSDVASRKEAFLFVNGIYQAIDSKIKRGRKMVVKWNVYGELHLEIEPFLVA